MSGIISGIGRVAFELAFQCAPIILQNGVAAAIPGGMLPLLAVTEAPSFIGGLLAGGATPSLDEFFASFMPLPGSTLEDWQIGNYSFANQAVAANALIAQPLKLSMMMTCPARPASGGYPTKILTMMALKQLLDTHISQGGTFIVVTVSNFYTNLLLTQMTDATPAGAKQTQAQWQLDFVAPLLTLEQAQAVQNSLMSKLTTGTAIDGQPAWSGVSPSTGASGAGVTPSVIPAASGTPTTSPFLPPGAQT